jgi:hypothetical protein
MVEVDARDEASRGRHDTRGQKRFERVKVSPTALQRLHE